MRSFRRQSVLMPGALVLLAALTGLSCTATARTRRRLPVKTSTIAVSAETSAYASPKPLPAGPKAYTERDYAIARLKWRRKITAEAYRAVGLRSPLWDQAALNLLQAYTPLAAQQPGSYDIKQFLAAARPVMNTKCDDPLVLYAIGCALQENGQAAAAEPYLRRATEGYQHVPYPKATAWAAPLRLAAVCQVLGDEKAKEADKWLEVAVGWIAEATRERKWDGAERRVFWGSVHDVLNGALKPKAEQLYQAVTSKPGADEWLANMIGGEYRMIEAWKSRGCEVAGSVSQAGWRGFHAQLPLARAHFVKAWKLHPEFPEAAGRMIEVACLAGDGRAASRTWFDRSVAAQFDYLPAYRTYRFFALTPRWGGSHRQMYDFGRECLATKRFDTAVPDELYNAVWAISESDGEVGIWRQPGVYRDLRGLFEGGAAEPSRAKDIAGIRTREAAVAWRCGAYDDARRLLDKLDGSIAPQDGGNTVFEYVYGTPSSWALGEVYAATGPLASQVRKAEALYEASEASAALPIFKRALQDNTDQRAASYLRARVETCRIESELAGDKWVALVTSLDAWRVENGQWERGSDGSIIAPKPQGWETLVCAARMPRNFEVRAQVDLKPAGLNLVGAVVCGLQRMMVRRSYVAASAKGWAALYVSEEEPGERKHPKIGERNTLTAQVWDSRLTAYVNGELVAKDSKFEWEINRSAPAQVGLGARGREAGDVAVVFHDVQVRALREPPSAPRRAAVTQ